MEKVNEQNRPDIHEIFYSKSQSQTSLEFMHIYKLKMKIGIFPPSKHIEPAEITIYDQVSQLHVLC